MQTQMPQHAPGLDMVGGSAGRTVAAAPAAPTRLVAQRTTQRELDQFYTRADVAAACVAVTMGYVPDEVGLWLEPSAGTGAFLDLLPTPRLGLDLNKVAKHPEVKPGIDFIAWNPGTALKKPVMTVGNPPFGRNASLALRFMNKAMAISDVVAMILPRTFQKEAMQAKLDKDFQLVHDKPLEAFSFIHDDRPYDVSCCFQVWRRIQGGGRRLSEKRDMGHSDFRYVESPDDADFAFQRVGAKAGLVSDEGLRKSWKSHYFIKANGDADHVAKVRGVLEGIDWSEMRERTAGNPSIGKGELVAAYTEIAGPPIRAQEAFAF
jgi:hypothetical protein